MSKEEIQTKVASVVADLLELNASDVTSDKAFMDDLGADSIAVVELMLSLEESFGLTIDEDKATSMRTVGDVVSYIHGQAAAS